MASFLEIGLPSSLIEMPEKVFLRGQAARGRVHIVSESESYTAEEIKIILEVRISSIISDVLRRKMQIPLHVEENVEVTPIEKMINFEYQIPSTAPFTFDSGLVCIEWHVVLSIKSGIIPRVASQKIVVLPHFLRSGTPPPADEIPIPVCKAHSRASARYSPFYLWRYTGPLHRSSHIAVTCDPKEFTVGETIHGNVTFSDHYGSGTLRVYLVFLNKSQFDSNISEEEQLVLRTEGVFSSGTGCSFSCSLPITGYPTSESLDLKTWWVLRAVVSNPSRLTKVAEKEIFVKSLTF